MNGGNPSLPTFVRRNTIKNVVDNVRRAGPCHTLLVQQESDPAFELRQCYVMVVPPQPVRRSGLQSA